MQIGGLGGSHSASDHHVTNCIRDHHEIQKKTGGAAMKTSVSAEASAAKADMQPEGQFSLSAWLKNMLGNGRGFLRNFWDGGQAAADGTEGKQSVGGTEGNPAANGAVGTRQAAPQVIVPTDSHTAEAASVAVQPPIKTQVSHNHSYVFAAEDVENQRQTFWQKVKVRFHNVSGQLSGRLPQKFFSFQAKNSFQERQGKTKEDLRRYGRSRKDTVEIESVLAGDSYLMDSYDRNGEYSKLTTKK